MLARKEEILDALIDIFRKEGLSSDFTMSQLAKKVNIGKSTIYEYFKTKDEVLQLAVFRVVEQAVEMMKNHQLQEGSFEEMFKKELLNLFQIAFNSRFLFQLITPKFRQANEPKMQDEMTSKVQDIPLFYEKRFGLILQKGIEEKLIDPEKLEENSLLVVSMITGSIMRLANGNIEISKSLNLEDYINKVYDALIKITN